MSFGRSKKSRLRRFVADKSRLGIAGNEMPANRRVCKRGTDARKRASSAFSGSSIESEQSETRGLKVYVYKDRKGGGNIQDLPQRGFGRTANLLI
jgi:hypothetical protein